MSKPRIPKLLPERRAFTVAEACAALRISRATIYELMKAGQLKYFQIKSRRRISVDEIDRLMGDAA
jgi:excisionase family DNA binding protein